MTEIESCSIRGKTEPVDDEETDSAADLSYQMFVSLDETQRERRGDRRAATDTPAPPKSGDGKVEEQSTTWRDSTITLKLRDGKPFYLNDGSGEWDSADGELWVRRGTGGVSTWRGKVSIDENKSYVEETQSSGLKRISRPDGSITTSLTTAAGKEISITENKDGTREFNGSAKWTSTDGGKTWKSADSTFRGQLGIDVFGRYWREPDGRPREIAEVSAQTKQITERMAELAKKYNIGFGTAGKVIKYEWSDPETDTTKSVDVTQRMPTLEELTTLERCLKKYEHLAPNTADGHDFRGLQFNFISGAGDGSKVSLWGWYTHRKEVFFGPRNSRQTDGWEGFEGTVLHEVAHHLQAMRWTSDGARRVPREVLDTLGWRYNSTTGTHQLRDKDGTYWEGHSVRLKDAETHKWYYTTQWYPVVGDTVVKEQSRARTTQQMYDNIPQERRPCTKYFTYPTEAHAEALAMLMQNPRMLFERNQSLYRATRLWDQTDINAQHGLQDGRPKMIRGTDGNIVPNTPENRRRITDTENGWRKKTDSQSFKSKIETSIAEREVLPELCDGQPGGRI